MQSSLRESTPFILSSFKLAAERKRQPRGLRGRDAGRRRTGRDIKEEGTKEEESGPTEKERKKRIGIVLEIKESGGMAVARSPSH